VFEFDSFKQIVTYYRGLQKRIRSEMAGIYEECGGCHHRSEETCAGGGACQLVNRLDPAKLRDIERAHGEARLSS
jgi:hypothetical protein